MHRSLYLLFGLLLSGSIAAQTITVTDLSPAFGPISLEQLSMQSVSNLGNAPVEGQLVVFLLDQRQEEIVRLESFVFQLAAGESLYNTAIPWSRRPTFGPSAFSAQMAQMGLLSYGEFVSCFEFRATNGQVLAQSCQEKRVGAELNFSLIYPLDRSTITEERPLLTWEDWTSAGLSLPGLRYDLLLVAVEAGQSPAAALERNIPLLRRSGINGNTLLYPNTQTPLLKGIQYAWAVSAQIKGNELARAGIWTFQLAETDAPAEVPIATNYAMLDTRLSSRHYWFENSINIGFDNNEGMSALDYQIIDLENPMKPITTVPVVGDLNTGLNTLQIPTKELSLQKDQLYQLEVKSPRGQIYYLRFKIR